MATKAFKVTSYSTVVIEYSVTSGNTATTFKVTGANFGNTRSTGLATTGAGTVTVRRAPAGTGTVVVVESVNAHTKTKTLTVDNSIETSWTRTTSAQTKTIALYVTLMDTYTRETWTTSGTISVTVPALASWAVKYDANGGSGAPSSQTKWYGKALTLSSTKPTRSGWTFVGWNTSKSATTSQYAAGASYTGNAALTLYAIWSKKVTLSYNANGGTGAPSSQSATVYNGKTTTFKVSTAKPTWTGRTFLGWATTSSAASANGSYDPGDTTPATNANVALYAVWSLVKYAITYNANGGTGAPAAGTKEYGKAYTLPEAKPTRTDFSFTGWKASSDSKVYQPKGTYSTDAAATMAAQWTRIYEQPKIKGLKAWRADSAGAADDEGSFAKVSGEWEVCKSYNSSNAVKSLTVKVGSAAAVNATVNSDGTWGALVNAAMAADSQYTVTASLTDTDTTSGTSSHTVTATTVITRAFFHIDMNPNGGISFGLPAVEGEFGVGYTFRRNRASASDSRPSTPGDAPDALAHVGPSNGYHDSAGNPVGYDEFRLNTGDTMYRSFAAQRILADGADVRNAIYLYIGPNGEQTVGVTAPPAWRNALGASSGVWPVSLGGTGSTATIYLSANTNNQIITIGSNFTLIGTYYAQWGKLAMLQVVVALKADLSVPASGNITDKTVGTVASGKTPRFATVVRSWGNNSGAAWGYLNNAGALVLCAVEGTGAARTISKTDSRFDLCATYLLP